MKFNACKAILLVVLLVAVGGNAFGRNGCSLQGSWIGFDVNTGLVSWMSQVTGKDANQGNIVIDMPGLAAMYGIAHMTQLRGVWKKTGGNTFAFTTVAIASDATGTPIFLGKIMGRETLIDDCNTELITDGTVEFFLPAQNPFDPEEIPFATSTLLDHSGTRMHLELP